MFNAALVSILQQALALVHHVVLATIQQKVLEPVLLAQQALIKMLLEQLLARSVLQVLIKVQQENRVVLNVQQGQRVQPRIRLVHRPV